MKGIWVVAIIASILILGVLASAPEAAAVPITIEFTDVVTGVSGLSDPSAGVVGLVSLGIPISGTYTFDSLAPDTDGDSNIGRYAIDDFSVTIGLVTYSTQPDSNNQIFIINDSFGSDRYLVIATNLQSSFLPFIIGPIDELTLEVKDTDADVFDSDDLLVVPPDLSDFEQTVLSTVLRFTLGFDEEVIEVFRLNNLSFQTPDIPPEPVCGDGTIPQDDGCVVDPLIIEQRDAALADLNNLFTSNSCNPLAGTIQAVLDCITALNAEIAAKMVIIADLETVIADLQATLATLPEGIINSLIDGVNSLVGMDMLDAKDAKQSLKKLNEGLKKLEQGNEKACHEVEKFVKEVNELVEDGDLDAAKAQPLLDEANSLLAECPTDD